MKSLEFYKQFSNVFQVDPFYSTQFPSQKAWVDPGEGSFTCQVNRREWELNRDRLLSNQSP